MRRIGFTTFFLAFAACSAPVASDTAASLEDAPGVIRGTQSGGVHAVLYGDSRGPGGALHIEASRPIVASVGGVRVQSEPLISEWMDQVMQEFSEHTEGNLIKLSGETAEQIVRSVPLPPGAELDIQFDPYKE